MNIQSDANPELQDRWPDVPVPLRASDPAMASETRLFVHVKSPLEKVSPGLHPKLWHAELSAAQSNPAALVLS